MAARRGVLVRVSGESTALRAPVEGWFDSYPRAGRTFTVRGAKTLDLPEVQYTRSVRTSPVSRVGNPSKEVFSFVTRSGTEYQLRVLGTAAEVGEQVLMVARALWGWEA